MIWQEVFDLKNPAVQARDERIASLVRSRDEARSICEDHGWEIEGLKHEIREAIEEIESGGPHLALARLRAAIDAQEA